MNAAFLRYFLQTLRSGSWHAVCRVEHGAEWSPALVTLCHRLTCNEMSLFLLQPHANYGPPRAGRASGSSPESSFAMEAQYMFLEGASARAEGAEQTGSTDTLTLTMFSSFL